MSTAVLTTDYLKGRAARAVPGAAWSPETRAWTFDPAKDPSATRVALRLFPELRLRLEPEHLEAAEAAVVTDVRPFDAATEWATALTPAQLLPNVPAELRDKLYPYQRIDLGYLARRIRLDGGGYLGWDRGLGKTLGAITLIYELCEGCMAGDGVDQPPHVVIVTPNSSKETVWRPEVVKWDVLQRFEGRVYNLGGTKRHRDTALRSWNDTGGILLVHYEALRLVDWSKQRSPLLVIVDEAHRLANGSGSAKSPKFYKSLKQIKPKYKLALSGSIIVNSPEDFFGANHWLFPKKYSAKYRDWCDKYLHYVEGSFGRILVGVKPEKVEAMREELGLFTLVRRKQDELPGLPERIEQTLRVELSAEQRRVYNDIAESFLTTLPDGSAVTVGSVLAQLGKLRQIATGLDLLGEDITDSSKLDLAEQLITDNLPHKTVVFTWHKATARSLGDRLASRNVGCAVITGDTPMPERARLVEAFQTMDEPHVMVATIKTLGESVTLHAAADVIFIESSWTPTDMEQAADRVYRIGQKRRVTVTHIVAADTVDESRVLPAVLDKAAMRRIVLGGD